MLQQSEEVVSQLDGLVDIYERVRDICTKIVEMESDPFPGQLEQSVPGYFDTMQTYLATLKRRRWPILVSGESMQTTADVVSLFLGDPSLQEQLVQASDSLLKISYSDRQKRYYGVSSIRAPGGQERPQDPTHDTMYESRTRDDKRRPLVIDNWDGVVQCLLKDPDQQVTCTSLVDIYVPFISLEDGLDLIVVAEPDKQGSMDVAISHAEPVGFMYVTDSRTVLNGAADSLLPEVLRTISMDGKYPTPALNTTIVCLNLEPKTAEEDLVAKVKESFPLLERGHLVVLPSSADGAPCDTGPGLQRMRLAIQQMIATYLDNAIYYQYSWLQVFVLKVLNLLRAFLSQGEKSHEERLATYAEILRRLQSLHHDADRFFKFLRQEVDTKVDEATMLLRHYITSDDVISRLATWHEDETPDDELWNELDQAISRRISSRIYNELLAWERNSHLFENMRPYLVELFEVKFLGIRNQIQTVESMIARHDSTISMLEDYEARCEAETTMLSSMPSQFNLNFKQKILLGFMAPILLPFAVTAAILSLPILGGLAAKEYIAEKLGENKLREYNADKCQYMEGRTNEEIHKFAKSKKLEAFVNSELRPAYQCISQLRQEVPRQIEAFRSQIGSLRNDDRDSKDLARFYQPLVEVFEHFRQMMLVYKVVHLKRERLDVDFADVEVAEDTQVICDGLGGTIQTAFLCQAKDEEQGDKDSVKKAVCLKFITHKLNIKNVDEYLLEEEAYRFQASANITRFLGVTKYGGYLYHLLEPLRCSLGGFLGQHRDSFPADRDKYIFLKGLLVQVLQGLEYLHERGWVHFDVSLEALAVGPDDAVKLTNIGCRKIYQIPRDVSQTQLLRYTHLPPEVLVRPPAAYTQVSEMYSLGIMMWEMWCGTKAYLDRLNHASDPIQSLEQFTSYIQEHRPDARPFYAEDEQGRAVVTSPQADFWLARLQQCWGETDRVSCKVLLQLLQNSAAENLLPMLESHYLIGE